METIIRELEEIERRKAEILFEIYIMQKYDIDK